MIFDIHRILHQPITEALGFVFLGVEESFVRFADGADGVCKLHICMIKRDYL